MPIEDRLLGQLRSAIRHHVEPHRHSALLAAIIAAFAVSPLVGDTDAGTVAFSLALVLLLLVALYNINVNIDELVGERSRLLAEKRRRRILGWTLATAAALGRVSSIVIRGRTLYLVGSICWLLFVLYVTVSELRSLLKQREVTGETICMAISVYLLLGFAWGYLYVVMFELNPESFGGLATAQSGSSMMHTVSLLAYFSLTTLSTIGFGDITPLTLQARHVAVAEGITGQFYMAILVARLVGMQMSRSPKSAH